MTDELENKAAAMLASLTEALTEGTSTLTNIYTLLREQNKDDPELLEKINELAMNVMAKIPYLTQVVGDSTKVLETYLSYRISKRQEEATNSLLKQNESLVKQNRILSYATVLLALSTFALVLVTVFNIHL